MFLMAGIFFFLGPGLGLRVKLGRLLDQDRLYLKTGQVIDGWVIGEDEDRILIEMEGGSFSLPRSQCKKIQRDIFLRYLYKLM
jgi:hypothetical protein